MANAADFHRIQLLAAALVTAALMANVAPQTYQFPVSLAEGFSFCFATRPIYVERIDMDASRLRNVENLRFERFLPIFDRTATSDRVTDRVFNVVVQNWVLKGHGVILCWQPTSGHRALPA